MTQNQTPDQMRTPYAANPTAPASQVVHGVGASPSSLGVVPDARLAERVPVAGVPVDVRRPAPDGRRRLRGPDQRAAARVRERQLLPAVHRPARDRVRHHRGDLPAQRDRGPGPVLRLRRDARPDHRAHRRELHAGHPSRPRSSSASAMFGAAAIYGKVTQRSLAKLGGILFMGLIGLLVAIAPEHLPAEQRGHVAHLDRRGRAVHGADRLRRPADPVGRPRGAARARWRRRPSSARSSSTSTS